MSEDKNWVERIDGDRVKAPAGALEVEALIERFVDPQKPSNLSDAENLFPNSPVYHLLYTYENLYAHSDGDMRKHMAAPDSVINRMVRFHDVLVTYRSNSNGENDKPLEEFISAEDVMTVSMEMQMLISTIGSRIFDPIIEAYKEENPGISNKYLENLEKANEETKLIVSVIGSTVAALDNAIDPNAAMFDKKGLIADIERLHDFYDPPHQPVAIGDIEESPKSKADMLLEYYTNFAEEIFGGISTGIVDTEDFGTALYCMGETALSMADRLAVGGSRLVEEDLSELEVLTHFSAPNKPALIPMENTSHIRNYRHELESSLLTLDKAFSKWHEKGEPDQAVAGVMEELLDVASNIVGELDKLLTQRENGQNR